MERLEIHRKVSSARNSAPNGENRCWATGKPRGVYGISVLQKSAKAKSS